MPTLAIIASIRSSSFTSSFAGAPKVVAVVPHGIPDAASRWVALAIPVGLSVYAVYAACPETFFVLVVYFIAHTGTG